MYICVYAHVYIYICINRLVLLPPRRPDINWNPDRFGCPFGGGHDHEHDPPQAVVFLFDIFLCNQKLTGIARDDDR